MRKLNRFLFQFILSSTLLLAFQTSNGLFAQIMRSPDANDIKDLHSVIANADRVRAYRSNELVEENLAYTSTNSRDLISLRKAIHIEPPQQWFQCACLPSTVIRFYKGEKQLGSLEVYLGNDIRYSSWHGDARITNPESWFNWLDKRGITWERKEYDRENKLAKAAQEAEERWIKAMPASLKPLWPDALQSDMPVRFDTVPLEAALSREFPDQSSRILHLLAWYGNGAGPWSGFPAYESVASTLLLEYSTPDLLRAVQSAHLDEQQTEGAGRLFGGWDFRHTRPNDIALIPSELKNLLLEHSLKSKDPDKLQRAKTAFASR
jgi:hypothetical protein